MNQEALGTLPCERRSRITYIRYAQVALKSIQQYLLTDQAGITSGICPDRAEACAAARLASLASVGSEWME